MSRVLKVFDVVSALLERMQYLEAYPDVSHLTSSTPLLFYDSKYIHS